MLILTKETVSGVYSLLIQYSVLIGFSYTLFKEEISRSYLVHTLLSLFFMLLLDSILYMGYLSSTGRIPIYVAASLFASIYSLRFWNKPKPNGLALEIVKLLGVYFVVIVFCFQEEYKILTLPILGIIYSLSTFTNLEITRVMKNIMVACLIVVLVFLFVFSQIQLEYSAKEKEIGWRRVGRFSLRWIPRSKNLNYAGELKPIVHSISLILTSL